MGNRRRQGIHNRMFETRDLVILPLVEKDLKFLNTTRNLCKDWLHNPTEYTLEETKNWWSKLDHTIKKYFLIKVNGECVGYLRWDLKTKYIGGDIHPDFRQKGYAYRAYCLFLDKAFEYVPEVFLEVLDKNDKARALYKKLGFIQISFGKSILMSLKKNSYRKQHASISGDKCFLSRKDFEVSSVSERD